MTRSAKFHEVRSTVFDFLRDSIMCSCRHMNAKRAIAALAVVLGVQVCLSPAQAGELNLADGVVVKFGPEAQLVVRDRLIAGKGVVLSSQKDDTSGGMLGNAPQVPAAGDWRGMRLEKSAAAYGSLTLSDLTIRYAGAFDGMERSAALAIRAWNPTLKNLLVTDSVVGLRFSDGAKSAISGSSFLRNEVGIEADGNSAPNISNSQLAGNTAHAVDNKTPASVISASGNWWGHASGPKEATANPQGLGDRVSPGVKFDNFLTSEPLLNASVRLAEPAVYFEQHALLLDLSCTNATEYRVAEDNAFAGVAFQPLTSGWERVFFVTSAGDGKKNINVQFRNSAGTVLTAALEGGALVDTQPPGVQISNPATGSLIAQPITIEASATDASGIAKVQFYLDDVLVATRTSTPWTYNWNTDASTEGEHSIRVVATDAAGRVAEHGVAVTLARTPPAPDVEGPVLANVKVGGSPLVDGITLQSNAALTFSASDRSGIARIELLLDGGMLASASTQGGNYTVNLDLDGIANGSHVLTLRAQDSLGNVSVSNYQVTVNHAAPPVPVLTQPANGLTTRTASISVAGQAQPGSTVHLTVNGQPAGNPVSVGSDGLFSGTVTLMPGDNQLQATASNSHGVSAASPAVVVTLDTTVPSSPTSLTAVSLAAGKVRLTWTRSADSSTTGYQIYRAANTFDNVGEALKVNASAVAGTVFEDIPPQDGVWNYRVAAVNGSGTLSLPSNMAQVTVDGTVPRALSIVYTALGKTDPGTGRIGQGRVNLVLTVSEALQTPPYLAIVPQGGIPIAVELASTGNTTYAGSFLIDASTPSGIANALFSARDAAGNRGTDIDAGATLKIDTEGPSLSGIVLTPGAPIKNDTAQTIQATFSFSKAPAGLPEIRYALSGPVRAPVTLNSLTKLDAVTFKASFALPSDAGMGSPEILSFAFQAKDDLDNASNKVSAFNRFQVYQGELPPVDAPMGFNATARPGGKVRLVWQAVDGASSYQIYRQAPEESGLTPLVRVSGIEHIDQTPRDGTYRYAVASVRQSNGQESLSGQSAPVEVTASASAPGAPQNLTLSLTGQGIYASWQPPLASTVDYYNLYRAGGTAITGIEGLTPLKTRIKTPQTYDTNPSPTQGAYVVTAVDAAGNESAISNSAYLNASLLPVRNLKVEQIGNSLPVLTWAAPNGAVSGYLVYVGPDSAKVKLTASPITGTSLTDTGYTAGERRYTVASVDANGVEMPRTLLLPSVTTQVAAGLPIKRGIMNKLQVQVTNTSGSTLDGARVVVRLPINKEGTQFKDHKSEEFSLAANQTRLLPVIVGGYADLPGSAQAQVGVEIAPNEGELVRVSRTQAVDVTEGSLVVGMATDEFTRGGVGKLKLTIENTTEVDVELLTATGNGSGDSSELRFQILDGDGNILANQPYKQVFGANVVMLTNGLTVARVPAGASYVSDTFNLNVPGASPNSIRVRLVVDKLRYHSGQEDEIIIAGRGSERTVSLIDTTYVGEITDVNPISSFGDQDIVITGRSLDRATQAPLANTRLKLILNQQGFERGFSVLTDAAGNFIHTFKPTLTDAGLYKVSAVHPDITDRPEQKAFTINRVTVEPAPFKLDVPKNYAFTIPFKAKAGVGTSASNLRLVLNAASQPTGEIPEGIDLRLPAPVTLGERQSLNVPVVFTANNEAQPSGTLVLDVISDEHAGSPISQVKINYLLSEAKPYLVSTPNYLETGLAQGNTQVETITLKNNGLQDALDLQFQLTKADGNPAPAWASIASHPDGTLSVGQSRSIDLFFAPPSGTPEAVYEFKLQATGTNLPNQAWNVYVSLTQSGQGSVLFKAADIYTATIGKDGKLIAGLAGAKVVVQNEDVVTVSHELLTDSMGEAFFQNIPAGRYKFKATAANHQEVTGRLTVKPGITLNQAIFLDYNLVTVEWSVKEITIQDRYEITLNATYETDVPAAVVIMQPTSINLPKMEVGDVYYGELTLTNFGLVRADNFRQQFPKSDGTFRYEFLVDIPSSLEAKQRVTIPYRVIALKSLEEAASGGNASGGGCYSYSATYSVGCTYDCANGTRSNCGASTTWFAASNSSCGGVGGSGGWSWWGVGGGGGSWGGGDSLPNMPPCTKCNGQCCLIGGGNGGNP
ncbi:MAG TPA: hypothetical protein GXX56_06090 [Rhodocyclaceae bacterium]|nr:hypothetical protein [Rhodocyclaceae bacterium]